MLVSSPLENSSGRSRVPCKGRARLLTAGEDAPRAGLRNRSNTAADFRTRSEEEAGDEDDAIKGEEKKERETKKGTETREDEGEDEGEEGGQGKGKGAIEAVRSCDRSSEIMRSKQ